MWKAFAGKRAGQPGAPQQPEPELE